MEIIKEKIGIRGIVTLRSHPAGTVERIKSLREQGKHAKADRLLHQGKIESRKENLVVNSANCGYDALVQFLISGYTGSFAFPLGIAYGELGTGSTTPASTDVALTTPTNRVPVGYGINVAYIQATVQFYFPDATVTNGTYYECGSFIGGTVTIGTGNMFNHALFASSYTKASGTDLTVQIDFLFS